MKYYSLNKIKAYKATYNIIFGERSNGKTYALLKEALTAFVKNNSQFGYIRRWKEDITPKRCSTLFAPLVEDGTLKKLTNGSYEGITYRNGGFYLCNYDSENRPQYADCDQIGFAFALTEVEHNKSTSYPRVDMVIFDEFLSTRTYINDEFMAFTNTISTIVRKRDDVIIYMLGNTVNKYCPYFSEMGLTNAAKMKQGTIDIYQYGNSDLTVAVEYCSPSTKSGGASSKYFAFNNPKLEMIKTGAWELGIYPHLPVKYKPKDVLLTYYIEFDCETYQCEIIDVDGTMFTYIHRKTTPIKNPDRHMIYSLEYHPEFNYNRSIFRPMNKAQERIAWFYQHGKVFYQDNSIGNAIENYLKICRGIR